jgi:hypothetical protein
VPQGNSLLGKCYPTSMSSDPKILGDSDIGRMYTLKSLVMTDNNILRCAERSNFPLKMFRLYSFLNHKYRHGSS